MRAEREVLLEQRSASQTVMPGMWELPTLPKSAGPIGELRLSLRHAIMQINYAVEIRAVAAGDLPAAAQNSARRHWVPVSAVKALPLTGLARKVLLGSKLAEMAPQSGSAVTVSGS
jgi:A/G-specific adenine glycosylase